MHEPDWSNPNLERYLIIGGVSLALLVFVFYLIFGKRSASFGSRMGYLASLLVGAGIGIGSMFLVGYRFDTPPGNGSSIRIINDDVKLQPAGVSGGGPAMGKGGGGRGGKMGGGDGAGKGKGGGGPGGMGGGRGPSSKTQLAALVGKLDVLTAQPLKIELTSEQKDKMSEQLKGLEAMEALDEAEAKKRLDAMLTILDKEKKTLEAAGFRIPGQAPGAPPADAANPFKEGEGSQHLKGLQTLLMKK